MFVKLWIWLSGTCRRLVLAAVFHRVALTRVWMSFGRRGSVLGGGHLGAGGDDPGSAAACTGKPAVSSYLLDTWQTRTAADQPFLPSVCKGLKLRQQHGPASGPALEHGRRRGTLLGSVRFSKWFHTLLFILRLSVTIIGVFKFDSFLRFYLQGGKTSIFRLMSSKIFLWNPGY